MNVILDTQVMIWFFEGSEELSLTARQTIESKSNTCFISIASIWETVRYRSNMVKRIAKQALQPLKIRHSILFSNNLFIQYTTKIFTQWTYYRK